MRPDRSRVQPNIDDGAPARASSDRGEYLNAEGERELVRAVAAATTLTLENDRLATQLRANVEQLRASRTRIVESSDEARRRLERDLHDGAQQRLVSLALSLRVLGTRVDGDPGLARELDAARSELELALDDLRELARGIHPAILTAAGLDGHLGLHSPPGEGTTLRARMPCG
jgi:signal transduction histidine kinase